MNKDNFLGKIARLLIINRSSILDRSIEGREISYDEYIQCVEFTLDKIISNSLKINQEPEISKKYQNNINQDKFFGELFDEEYYREQLIIGNYEMEHDLPLHFKRTGWRLGLNPNPLFSVAFYLSTNNVELGEYNDPLSHYITEGSFQKFNPHPLFLTDFFATHSKTGASVNQTWLTDFLDVDNAAPMPHPLIRPPKIRTEKISKNKNVEILVNYICDIGRENVIPLFDKEYYRSQFSFPLNCIDLYEDYFLFGRSLGAKPHRLFDPEFFKKQILSTDSNTNATLCPDELTDYIMRSDIQETSPHPLFDQKYYHSKYHNSANFCTPLEHFIDNSNSELNPSPNFDSKLYKKFFGVTLNDKSALEDFLIRISSSSHQYLKMIRFQENYDISMRNLKNTGDSDQSITRLDEKAVTTRNYPGRKSYDSKKHNILLVAHLVGEYLFGSERSFLDILVGLDDCPVNVFVALPRNNPGYTNLIRDLSCGVYVFSYGWWSNSKTINSEAIDQFRFIMNEHQISAVHVNTIMIRDAIIAARSLDITTVVHVRELIEHDRDLQQIIGYDSEVIRNEIVSCSDWIIGNSQITTSSFYKPNRSITIYNTIQGDDLLGIEHLEKNLISFGVISSNIPKKGILDLIAVAKICEVKFPSARFFLIGPDNKFTEQLKIAQIKEEVPSNVVFFGYTATVEAALLQLDVVLSISHFAESFGRTVLEAMAASKPVIAYEYGAVSELISHNKSGILVPFKNIQALADAVQSLIRDRSLIKKLGEEGRKIYLKKFAPMHFNDSIKRFYSNVLENKPLPERSIKILNRRKVKHKNDHLRLAYFCWHFPVPSETFVHSELRELVKRGVDVRVFCYQIPNPDLKFDFNIQFERVSSVQDLAKRLVKTGRNFVHAHFTYPTVTNMVWPACEMASIEFSFIAHAQDIFRYENDKQNRLAEIGQSQFCRSMFTLSNFHKDYVIARGFPVEKIVINPNAVDIGRFAHQKCNSKPHGKTKKIVAVGRFVEKKGFELLLDAARALKSLDVEFHIYGYGELHDILNAYIAEHALKKVVIHGPIDHDDMPLLLNSTDLFVCPCVQASDGDMDGIPTTIIEAMAARVPVLTTSIGALPEVIKHGFSGFIVEPSSAAIVAAINEFCQMSRLALNTITEQAYIYAVKTHDSRRLVSNLLRVWTNDTVDIVIVSWNNLQELEAVIDSVIRNTTSPFHLIICDNNSMKEPVRSFLHKVHRINENVTVVLNNANEMVGPGTNICVNQGNSDIVIYVCGKEGFIFKTNWEFSFINSFYEKPLVGLAGTICVSPSYITGSQYPVGIKLFESFRNKFYAEENPNRIFGHVQGGLFGMRRTMYDQIGGFSEAVPHDYTDVEYSFYAESCGWALAEIEDVLALFNKSRPSLSQRFRSDLVAAHPVSANQLDKFDSLQKGTSVHCNVCDWYGDNFLEHCICPTCLSTMEDRTCYRWLSESIYMFRRLPAIGIGFSPDFSKVWSSQFQGPRMNSFEIGTILNSTGRLANRNSSMYLGWLQVENIQISRTIVCELSRLIIIGSPLLVQVADYNDEFFDLREDFIKICASFGFKFIRMITYQGSSKQFSSIPILEFTRIDASTI